MKKLLSMLLALTLIAGLLAGCGGNKNTGNPANNDANTTIYENRYSDLSNLDVQKVKIKKPARSPAQPEGGFCLPRMRARAEGMNALCAGGAVSLAPGRRTEAATGQGAAGAAAHSICTPAIRVYRRREVFLFGPISDMVHKVPVGSNPRRSASAKRLFRSASISEASPDIFATSDFFRVTRSAAAQVSGAFDTGRQIR